MHWTEDGHRFAWHMLARTKSGETRFTVTDPKTGRWWTVDPVEILTQRQADNMAGRPDMILQFAHHLAALARQRGVADAQVRVRAMVSLNGRRPQLLVDPAVDLARVPRAGWHLWWVVPLSEPLPSAGSTRPAPNERPQDRGADRLDVQ